MSSLILLLLAILPGIFFIYWYYSKDVYKKEPWGIVWKSFFWGAATVIPACVIELSIDIPFKNEQLIPAIIENFIAIALVEELCKYAAIRFYSFRNVNFDEMMDGIVYGAAVGSGFATFENIFYVMENGMAVGIMRAVVSVPSHILEGAVIGYWLAKARFENKSTITAAIIGVSISTLNHGFFDFCIQYWKEYFYLLLVPVFVLAFLVKRYVKSALEFDYVNIHLKSDDPIKQHEAELIHDRIEEKQKTASAAKTHSDYNPYVRKLIYMGLTLAGWVILLSGLFLLFGFGVLYSEGKQEILTWEQLLWIIPCGLGGFFIFKSRKWRD